MSDIATLGLAVDSSQVTQATKALGGLAAASKPAADAAKGLTDATNDQAKAHGGMSTQAMAAQHSIRSLVEAMASGQPISQALGQQINHLSYAASGPGGLTGAFKAAAGSLLGLLSPAALVVGGLAAVGVAGLVAIHSLAESEKQFDDLSRSIGVTIGQLHGLQSAASLKGIDSADFFKAMEKFGSDVYDAQHNMGPLAESFRATGQSAKTFNDYLSGVADKIKNAASDAQRLKLLQEAGLPANMQWVRFMQQGADGIKAAVKALGDFNESAEGRLIANARRFDDEWNTAWTHWGNTAKGWTLTVADALDGIIGKASEIWKRGFGTNPGADQPTKVTVGAAPGGTNTFSPPPGANIKTAAERQKEISDAQTLIGLYGQTASAAQIARQVQLTNDAAYLSTGVSVGQKKIDQLKELAVQQYLGITAIKASTDAQNVEAQTVGMSVGQAAAYAAAQNAINDAKRAGRPLTDANVAAIKAEANSLGQATTNADNLKFAFDNLVQGPMETFTSQIAQGATAMDALKAAGTSALNAIAKKLADMASQSLWSAAFGGSGGGGGFLASLFGGSGVTAGGGIAGAVGGTSIGGAPLVAAGLHGGGGPGDAPTFTRYVHPAYFDDAPRYHSGIGPGEQAAVIRTDESVLTPGQMGQLAPVNNAPPVVINQTNNFTGNDPGTEARIRQQIAQSKQEAVQAAVQAVQTTRSTNPTYLRGGR